VANSATRAPSPSIRRPPPISQLTAEEQQATGVTDDYVRLSIGIEHIDDILRRSRPGAEGGGVTGAAGRSAKRDRVAPAAGRCPDADRSPDDPMIEQAWNEYRG